MLILNQLCGFGAGGGTPNPRMLQTLQYLGLTTNLKLCLDARDSASYTSGQKWLDLAGSGYDFFLGTNGSAAADDPTFTGSAGDLAAYFSFDGADFATYDTSNETWMNNLHKNNALFTLLFWVWLPSPASLQVLVSTTSNITGTTIGLGMYVTSSLLEMKSLNGSATALQRQGTLTIPSSQWAMLALTIDEANSISRMTVNATTEQFSDSYTSPSASNAAKVMTIGTDGSFPLTNTSRIAAFTAWEGTALTAAQLNLIYQETRGAFGV